MTDVRRLWFPDEAHALLYAGTVVECRAKLEPKTQAWYDPTIRKVTCTLCKSAVVPTIRYFHRPRNRYSAPPTATFAPPFALASIPGASIVPIVRTDRQKGAELEQRISAVMSANGYSTRTNVFLGGRSGARHEIDVIGSKSDGLTTLSVAVECKAWEPLANP